MTRNDYLQAALYRLARKVRQIGKRPIAYPHDRVVDNTEEQKWKANRGLQLTKVL